MQSNKNSKVKSKRTQLSIKKNQKIVQLSARVVDLDSQINLISSEQSSSHNIKVVETQQQKTQAVSAEPFLNKAHTIPVYKFNLFNYSRLAKSTPPLLQINSQLKKSKITDIQIVVDNKPLSNNTQQAYKSYTFSIEGQKEEIKIKDAFLSDVASKQMNTISKRPETDKTQKQALSQQMIGKQSQKKSRYFQVSHEICFKCNKEGHYAKNCINQDMRKCKICFSRLHDQHSCPPTCYQCGQSGHISSQCPYSKSQRCQKCRQRGHTSNYCGVVLRDKECINNFEAYFSESDLKKMKCIIEEQHQKICKKGPHFNCFVYKDWPMPYHQLRKSQNRHSNSSKNKNQSRSTYRIHEQGYLFTKSQFEPRQEGREHQHYHNNQQYRFYSDRNRNDNKRWRKDEFEQSSRFFDDHKKGNKWKWEKKGRNSNRDSYY